MTKITINELFQAVQGHIGRNYLLQMSRINNKAEVFNIASGIIENVELLDYAMLIYLDDKSSPEKFSFGELKEIQQLEGNSFKYIYLDGSYFIIILESEIEYIARKWDRRLCNIEKMTAIDENSCKITIYGELYTLTKDKNEDEKEI